MPSAEAQEDKGISFTYSVHRYDMICTLYAKARLIINLDIMLETHQ